MCRFWIISDGGVDEGICAHEEENLPRLEWIDNELCYGGLRSSSEISLPVIRRNEKSLLLILKYRRKYPNSHTRYVTGAPELLVTASQFLVLIHEDLFPPVTAAYHSEQTHMEEKKCQPRALPGSHLCSVHICNTQSI
jgi:hypothetical protein